MKTVIGILTKATFPEGRVGPEWAQDWCQQCAHAVDLAQELKAEVLTTSRFVSESGVNDEDNYVRVVKSLGSKITRLSEGVETWGQLEAMMKYADEKDLCLIVGVTLLHYPRVQWYSWRHKLDLSFLITLGIPRPREAVTDLILIVVYPIIDIMGLHDRLRTRLLTRREAGKF